MKPIFIFILLMPFFVFAAEIEDKNCDEIRNQKLSNTMNFLKDTAWKNLEKSEDQSYYSEFTEQNNPYQYVTRLFTRILYQTCDVSQKNVIAYVNKGQNEIIFCKSNDDCLPSNDSSLGLLDMATTLVHEARHIENPNVGHVVCPRGAYRSQKACDQNRSVRGGYHFETDYVVGLSRNSNLNLVLRVFSAHFAMSDFLNRFKEIPNLDVEKYILIQDSQQNLYLLSSNFKIIDLNIKIQNNLYDNSNGDFILYNKQEAQFHYKSYSLDNKLSIPKLAFKYNNFPVQDDSFIDYQITQNGTNRREIMLFRDKISVSQEWTSQFSQYDLAEDKKFRIESVLPENIKINSLITSRVCLLDNFSDKNEVLLLSDKNTVYRPDWNEDNLLHLETVKCAIDFSKYKKQTVLDKNIIRLSKSGQLLDEKGIKIKGLENKRIIFMSEPFDILRFMQNENWKKDFILQFAN